MQVSKQVHQIKVTFYVTPQIERFVYLYLITGKQGCYLIDSGVDGTEKIVEEYMRKIGRDIHEIKRIFLTHSHPDHIGAAAKLKELTGCIVYGCEEEREWIEEIEKQFRERPIPNFHTFLNRSVSLDFVCKNGEEILLESGITLSVISTHGHSKGSTTFFYQEENILFTGDAIPVIGDIPIYVSYQNSMVTLEKIKRFPNVKLYCSAWTDIWSAEEGKKQIEKAEFMLQQIDDVVKNIMKWEKEWEDEKIFKEVCKKMNFKQFEMNPLFQTSIEANIKENKE